jgi:prepilin-type N-terminal cleavage/methylation domain-containing protein
LLHLNDRSQIHSKSDEGGFSLVELVIVMTVTLIMSTMFYTFFKTNLVTYLNLQKDASGFTDVATQSARIANVMRGVTDITSAASNDIVVYSYFYPTDTYVSQVHYYLNATSTILYADVTPMTSNPPVGTLITASKKTYTIIGSFKQTSGQTLFNYLDSGGAVMTLPIGDLHTVKGIRVNLGAATATGTNQAMTLDVSLRNRKTNL